VRRTAPYAGVLVLLMFAVFSTAQESHPPHWSYSGAESPAHWGNIGVFTGPHAISDQHYTCEAASECRSSRIFSVVALVHQDPQVIWRLLHGLADDAAVQ